MEWRASSFLNLQRLFAAHIYIMSVEKMVQYTVLPAKYSPSPVCGHKAPYAREQFWSAQIESSQNQ